MVCRPPGIDASSMTPVKCCKRSGLPSMVACQPGTSVRRRRSISRWAVSVVRCHDARVGMADGDRRARCVGGGGAPAGTQGHHGGGRGPWHPVQPFVVQLAIEHGPGWSGDALRLEDEPDAVERASASVRPPGTGFTRP